MPITPAVLSRSFTTVALRALLVATLAAAAAMLLPSRALAHVTVWPKAAALGGYERYVIRVPNEKNVATTRVEIRFPAEARISSFADVAGWQLEVLTDSAGKVIGAVWTGSLPPKRFVEFPFVAVNPKTGERLVWPAFQTYADGERVEWTGPVGSKRPASVTELAERATGGGSRLPLYLASVAVVLALASLGLSLRRTDPVRA
jgi:uncharacterized protein YcnI